MSQRSSGDDAATYRALSNEGERSELSSHRRDDISLLQHLLADLDVASFLPHVLALVHLREQLDLLLLLALLCHDLRIFDHDHGVHPRR